MRNKLIAVFLMVTILPAGLLIWLGVMNVKSEEDRNRRSLEALAKERLAVVNHRIENIAAGLEAEIVTFGDLREMTADEIRELTRRSRLIRQVFIMDFEGLLRYPSEDIPLSEQERDFLVRTRELGLSPGLFVNEAGERSDAGRSNDSGWYVWYYGEGLNFMFWRRSGDSAGGAIVGVELNRMAVISAVVNGLPDTDAADAGTDGKPEGIDLFRVSLTDVGGATIYQWGSYAPADMETPVVSVPAPYPVSSWRLNYFANHTGVKAGPGRIAAVFGPLMAIILALSGLSFYLYRESSREVREAGQRVSFVNQVSHELKTPLTNIRMYAELLEESAGDNEDAEGTCGRYAAVIASESRRLSRLIANVLTFSKEGKTGLVLNTTAVEPEEVIRSAAAAFGPAFKEKGIELVLYLRCGGTVLLDRDALEQITVNLLSNVEKYAALGGYLKIAAFMEEDMLSLTVEDGGPGIPSALWEKVFEPFYRISDSLTDGTTGTGIGLSIVRSLSRLHGGDAYLLPSEKGAKFRITLKTTKTGEGHEHTGG